MKAAIAAAALMAAAYAQTAPARLSLNEALDIAGKASPEIQIARLKALESYANAAQVRSGLLPQLTATVAANYQTTNLAGIGVSGESIPARVGPYRVFDARPRLTQKVLDLSLLSASRAARYTAKQMEHDSKAVVEQTQLAIIEVYLQSLQADSRRRAAAARVETARALLAQTEAAEQAGTASKLDLARARQQMESEESVRLSASRDAEALTVLLVRTIGLEATGFVQLEPLPAFLPAAESDIPALTTEALQSRHEVRAMDAKRSAAAQEVQRALRERLPKIEAFGDFGFLGQDPSRGVSTYAVGGAVTIPIWTSGRIENDVKAMKYRADQVEQERRRVRNAIAQEVAEAVIRRDRSVESLAAARRAAAAAREALELARLRYGAGLSTNLDVVNAQSSLSIAQEEEIGREFEISLAAANLARARGDVGQFTARR
jgi:outer membrane protein TolC